MRLLIIVLLITANLQAEVWKCGDRYYSHNPGAKKCQPISADAICGSGSNKFITKGEDGKPGEDNAGECSGFFDTPRSPFVYLDSEKDLKSYKKINSGEKKLQSSAKADTQGTKMLPANKKFTKEDLGNIPLPGIAKDIITQYMDIWASYDKVLE